MNRYKATKVVRLHRGVMQLSAEQSAARRHLLTAVDEKKGLYELRGTVIFKVGEEFGFDGEIPKAMAAALEDPETGVTAAEVIAADKGKRVGKAKGKGKAKGSNAKANEPKPNMENMLDIIDIIDGLDKDKDFTDGGEPEVKAIEALLDRDITAAERDEAWKMYQESAS